MRIISGTARGTKLYTLEGIQTRPTLDRVKESIFNIIQNEIRNSIFLDLFSGSGAVALEAASRGAQKVIMCDKSKDAIKIINKNIEKTHLEEKVKVYNIDFKDCLKRVANEKIDFIYLDPPYKTDFIQQAIKLAEELNIIKDDTKIIVETDNSKIIDEITNLNNYRIDKRKYGRVTVIFIKK
ncbi:MAG: 16S rRNA (guanine(966)-N(2))-methyltransferase RsmD [Clostridia bacterium]|nr:16S rRNA (guanine(966)-N(2))-methyltransferase RsmD [Clostridia bacterium]